MEVVTNFDTQNAAIRKVMRKFAEETGYPFESLRICNHFELFGRQVRSFDLEDINYMQINKLTLYKRNNCYYGVFNHETLFGSLVVFQKGHLWRLVRYNKRMLPDVIKPTLPQEVWDSVHKNILNWQNNYEKYKQYGIKGKRGLILQGDPGNGKTLLCKWLEKELKGFSIHHLNQTSLEGRLSQDNMKDLLRDSKVMIICDDIDFNQLEGKGLMPTLKEFMDGMTESVQLRFCLFTTNDVPDTIHEPFLRPGRIDDIIVFKDPDDDLRRELIKKWDMVLEHLDIEDIMDATEGMSFAEIEEIRIGIMTKWIDDGVWEIPSFDRDELKKKVFGFAGLLGK